MATADKLAEQGSLAAEVGLETQKPFAVFRTMLPDLAIGQAAQVQLLDIRRMAIERRGQSDAISQKAEGVLTKLGLLDDLLIHISENPPPNSSQTAYIYRFETKPEEASSWLSGRKISGVDVARAEMILDLTNESYPSFRVAFYGQEASGKRERLLFNMLMKTVQARTIASPTMLFESDLDILSVCGKTGFFPDDAWLRLEVDEVERDQRQTYAQHAKKVGFLYQPFRNLGENLTKKAEASVSLPQTDDQSTKPQEEPPWPAEVKVGSGAEMLKLDDLAEEIKSKIVKVKEVYLGESALLKPAERNSRGFWKAALCAAETFRLQYLEKFQDNQPARYLINTYFGLFGLLDKEMEFADSSNEEKYLAFFDHLVEGGQVLSPDDIRRHKLVSRWWETPFTIPGGEEEKYGKAADAYRYNWWMKQYQDMVLSLVPADYLDHEVNFALADEIVSCFKKFAGDLFDEDKLAADRGVIERMIGGADGEIFVRQALRRIGVEVSTSITADVGRAVDMELTIPDHQVPEEVAQVLLRGRERAFLQIKTLAGYDDVALLPLEDKLVASLISGTDWVDAPGGLDIPGVKTLLVEAGMVNATPLLLVMPSLRKGGTLGLYYTKANSSLFASPAIPVPCQAAQTYFEKSLSTPWK